jgi:hypothetical protein
LNLAGHVCGSNSNSKHRKFLYSAADVEGHLGLGFYFLFLFDLNLNGIEMKTGLDGKYYMADFARVFPPVVPNTELPGSHLFQLFRPEFVSTSSTPLCSDGFSGFIMRDPKNYALNENIR